MRSLVLAAVLATVPLAAAQAAPVVTVKARTAISLDPVRSGYGGAVVRGQLVDRFTRDPVPFARLEVTVDYQTRNAWTDDEGFFSATFDLLPGTHDLVVEYAGDTHYTSATFEMKGFDVAKEPLEMSVRTEGTADITDEAIDVVVKAWTPSGGTRVPVDVYVGDAEADDDDLIHLGRHMTDHSGRASIEVAGARLSPAGPKRLVAKFDGDDAFNPTEAESSFMLTTGTTTEFRIDGAELAFESRLRGSGRVADAAGAGVPGAPVALVVGAKRVAEGLTGDDGGFSLSVSGSEIGEGSHNVQAVFEPSKAWQRSSRSSPVQVQIAAPQPVPIAYTIAAFAATLAAMLAFLALRTRFWERWLARLRRTDEAPAERPAAGEAPPVHTGLVEARPGLVSTLRRAHERGFSGQVRNAVTTRAVAGAVLTLDHPERGPLGADCDAAGHFELEELEPGQWQVRVTAFGYCAEEFAITVPHRGELRGARVDLLPVRERVFYMYREAAEPLLPEPGLWGIWTPRQIFDHVRQGSAPAWAALTDFVEETYFSQRIQEESVLPVAAERIEAARREAPHEIP
jgi:hypothetical protein